MLQRLWKWSGTTSAAYFGLAVSITGFLQFAIMSLVWPWWDGLQWGPLSGWVAAAVTFLAVGVALFSNSRSIDAAETGLALSRLAQEDGRDKAVWDRVYAVRRENLKAVADMWAALDEYRDALRNHVNVFYQLGRRAFYKSADGGESEAVKTSHPLPGAKNRAQAALGYAQAISEAGLVLDHVDQAHRLFEQVVDVYEDRPTDSEAQSYLDDWSARMTACFAELQELRESSTQLLRDELPLHDLAAEEVAARRERDRLEELARTRIGLRPRSQVHLNLRALTGFSADSNQQLIDAIKNYRAISELLNANLTDRARVYRDFAERASKFVGDSARPENESPHGNDGTPENTS